MIFESSISSFQVRLSTCKRRLERERTIGIQTTKAKDWRERCTLDKVFSIRVENVTAWVDLMRP